jgi:hypothetical protein
MPLGAEQRHNRNDGDDISFALLCRIGKNYLISLYTVALIAKLLSFN